MSRAVMLFNEGREGAGRGGTLQTPEYQYVLCNAMIVVSEVH